MLNGRIDIQVNQLLIIVVVDERISGSGETFAGQQTKQKSAGDQGPLFLEKGTEGLHLVGLVPEEECGEGVFDEGYRIGKGCATHSVLFLEKENRRIVPQRRLSPLWVPI